MQLFETLYPSPPGSSVHGILQAGILGCVAISSSRRSSRSRDLTRFFCMGGRFFTMESPEKPFISANIVITVKSSKSNNLELSLHSWIIHVSGTVPGKVWKRPYSTSFSKLIIYDLVQRLYKRKISITDTHNADRTYFIKDYCKRESQVK